MAVIQLANAAKQIELSRLAKAGDRDAYDLLVRAQAGLVRGIAIGFAKYAVHIELDDLIQEAYVGVIDAVRYFDPDRGFHFSTYAADCIRRRLSRFVQSKHVVPICAQEPSQMPDGDAPLENVPDDEAAGAVARVDQLLEMLPPLHRCIVRGRHSLDGRRRSSRTTGRLLGISAARVRELYQLACRGLREGL